MDVQAGPDSQWKRIGHEQAAKIISTRPRTTAGPKPMGDSEIVEMLGRSEQDANYTPE